MSKPEVNKQYTEQQLNDMEQEGAVFRVHDEKRVIGSAKKDGVEILFLEDGNEVIRAKDGTFLEDWP